MLFYQIELGLRIYHMFEIEFLKGVPEAVFYAVASLYAVKSSGLL